MYTVKDTGEEIELATTRPETMLGDTAIAVHPDDERYKTAMTNLSAIESALGMEKGEIKCFEEKPAISGN